MNTSSKILVAAALGTVLGAGVMGFFGASHKGKDISGEPEPLYWVAPMDSNYRRAGPGKSPMGMDLVPVYAEQAQGVQPGSVRISPDLVNNLGVRTGLVKKGRLSATVDTVGYVQYDEDQLVHVHPRMSGWIETLHVKAAGDRVRGGEPLYTLYSPMLVNAQEEFLLALRREDTALLQAASDRLAALQVPSAVIDGLRQARQVSQTITFHAPQDGVVDALSVREGMYVEPGMEIMSIGTLEQVWVVAEVFERQASLVEVGDPVTMRLDYLPGRQWQGRIDYVYPTLDLQTRTARMRMRVPNVDDYLRPGMFAQLEIASQPGEAQLLIPREALIRTGTQSRVVLALGEGRFKSVAVEVGRIARQQAEILSGLVENDRIVTSAQFLIDSESSKTSDFLRMGAAPMPMDHSQHEAMDHSQPAQMDHSQHEAMDHSQHQEMEQ